MWRHWLQDTIKKTKERLDNVQAGYKNNFEPRLCEQSEGIHVDDFAYLQVEQKKRKDHRHKLLPIVEGPLKVTNVDKNTVVV